MVRASLRYWYSPDIADLSESSSPDDPECFGFLLQPVFGPSDAPGEESFDLVVCTPRWFAQELRKCGGVLSGRHYLFVEQYDVAQLKKYILKYADQCSGRTWREVAEKLGRLGKWEFEDYKPSSSA